MSAAPQGPCFSITVEALRLREWLLGPGQATLVIAQFSADGFYSVVVDCAKTAHVTGS
ncbi:hypothetical protein [Streptomyces lienomycini]|uniref:Uncharacterized protein n=1 Tax=Streptomyces lienomycini TaxID=284035 RepID=A0ABV9WTY0_9ACTN|nr:hypothetical protein [Streptomyces lienomycini]